MFDANQVPATLPSLSKIVGDYESKAAEAENVEAAFKAAVNDAEQAAVIGGTYVGSIFNRSAPSVSARDIRQNLCKSAWRYVYNGLNIETIAPVKERKQFELALENPPEFTLDNIRATFGDYIKDPRYHILRGLAEVFCDLDPAYKSHTKVKIGVAGLPKRIIMSGFGEYSWGSYGREKFKDVLNALAAYLQQPLIGDQDVHQMVQQAVKHGSVMWWGGELKVFKNGNGHMMFDKETLRTINKALAEFYGDVLPDVDLDERGCARPGTDVAKDLQFYWTPEKVVHKILGDVRWVGSDEAPMSILDPSCGEGHMLDGLMTYVRDRRNRVDGPFTIQGIEYHAGRVKTAREKGWFVTRANFLEMPPSPRFDLILMNPPFYGLHWKKHLEHALKFRKPRPEGKSWGGGRVVCVLPATAFWDGHLGDMGLVRADAHTRDRGYMDSGWRDLPVGSFSDAGTNVPTGYITI